MFEFFCYSGDDALQSTFSNAAAYYRTLAVEALQRDISSLTARQILAIGLFQDAPASEYRQLHMVGLLQDAPSPALRTIIVDCLIQDS